MISEIKKPIFWGIGGGLILLLFYFVILTVSNSFSHALEQLQLLWYWISILIIGFGIQTGLYFYIRGQFAKKSTKTSQKELATSAGISSGSMVACCAHHLVDVLPILGLSAVFLFLAKYQTFFILIGIASNIIGIIFILEIIKKHSLFEESSKLSQMLKFNIKKLKVNAIIIAIIALAVSFFWIQGNSASNYSSSADVKLADNITAAVNNEIALLPVKTNEGGGLSIEVKPVSLRYDESIEFDMTFTTHQGDLNFDLTKQSFIVDGKGNKYFPLEWQGGMGGHHIVGKLIFSSIAENLDSIKFVINDIYGIEERVFEWNL